MIKLDVVGRDYGLEVIEYDVTEEITPLAPGDSSGGVGAINVSVTTRNEGPHAARTSTILDADIILTDSEDIEYSPFRGRGTVQGHVSANTEAGGRTRLTAETLLARFNTDRKAAPIFGAKKTGTRTTYVVNTAVNPSFEINTTNYVAIPGTGGTAALTRVSTTPYVGSWAGRVAWTVAATGPGGVSYQHNVIGGALDTFSSYMRMNASKAVQVMRASVQYYKAGAVAVGTAQVGSPVVINNSDYTRVSVAGLAPSDATYAIVSFLNFNSGENFSNWANGDILQIDGMMVTQGTTVYDYFDGSFANASWRGTANASESQLAITTEVSEGYDATVGYAMRYYSELVGLNQSNVVVDAYFDTIPVSYPAWEGNVWNHVKMLCAAVGAEVAVNGANIVFRLPRQHTLRHDNVKFFDTEVDGQATARNAEIYNYNNRWLSDSIVHEATSVISIDVGSSAEVDISFPHSITRINNPVASASLGDAETYVGPGQYVVMDANDVVVDPAVWRSLGAYITVKMVPDSYTNAVMTINGPNAAGSYTAPFRVATADEKPALFLTGEGVFVEKELVTVATAATLTQTSTEAAPTVDNPFISTHAQAVDRVVLTAMQVSGPAITISGVIPYDAESSGNEFDLVTGSRVPYRDSIYRVKTARFSSGSINITAESDVLFADAMEVYGTTFDEINAIYPGMNFTTYSALWGAQTFDEVMNSVAQPSFDTINALYEGMTFNDHAVYPLIPLTGTTEEPPVGGSGYGDSLYGSQPYGT